MTLSISGLLALRGRGRRGRAAVRTMSRPLSARLEALEARALLATSTWNNPAGGDWDTASNWTNGIPASTDNAVLPLIGGSAYTVTHNQTATDQPLNISAGSGVAVDVSAGILGANSATIDTLTVSSAGTFLLTAGTLNSKTITLNTGGTLQTNGNSFVGTAVTTNTLAINGGGTLKVHSGFDSFVTNVTLNANTFNNIGLIIVEAADSPFNQSYSASLTVPNGFSNTGTVSLNASKAGSTVALTSNAALSNVGVISLNAAGAGSQATLATSGTLSNSSGGTVRGTGQINTPLLDNVSGLVSPGQFNDTGVLTVNGNFSQESGGTLQANVGKGSLFTSNGSLASGLVVKNAATLAGTLTVNPIIGYTVAPDNALRVLAFGSRSGDFATKNVPTPPSGVRALQEVDSPVSVTFSNASPPGDFEGIGKTDLAVFRPGNDVWLVRQQAAGGLNVTQFGDAGQHDAPVPSDYDGVGKSQLAVFRASTDSWLIKHADNSVTVTQFGDTNAHDIPAPGDYEGTGKTDLAVYRPSTGQWLIRQANGSLLIQQFGDPANHDIPVPGDYEGIGKADLAVFRPATSQWLIRLSNGSVRIQQFGDPANKDIPAPGDYDGDGRMDFAVFRPGTDTWYGQYSSGGGFGIQFGDTAAKDIAATFASFRQVAPAGYYNGGLLTASAASASTPVVISAPTPDLGATAADALFSGTSKARKKA